MGRFPHEVGNINMTEFNGLLAQLGKKVAWEIELTGFGLSGKLKNEFNPLTPEKKPGVKSGKQPDTRSIINKVNKLVKR